MRMQLVGFVVGYFAEDFSVTVKWWAAGMAVACAVSLPDWPVFRRDPVRWLPAQGAEEGTPLVSPATALRRRRGKQ